MVARDRFKHRFKISELKLDSFSERKNILKMALKPNLETDPNNIRENIDN